ncbi:MAG: 50S ribosomal protein L9 [Candidatus Omnitrophica bacterium]|nr:50S ribosomal protein L9 [Candidatus Omnitrophota bacterium]
MDVILRQDVERVGQAWSVVKVKPGYARNFLLPQGLAMPATERNLSRLETERAVQAARVAKERAAAEAMQGRLNALSVTLPRPSGAEGRLFGSVTNEDIAQALQAQGITIDKRKILLAEPIKELGVYLVPVKLTQELKVDVKILVVKS